MTWHDRSYRQPDKEGRVGTESAHTYTLPFMKNNVKTLEFRDKERNIGKADIADVLIGPESLDRDFQSSDWSVPVC